MGVSDFGKELARSEFFNGFSNFESAHMDPEKKKRKVYGLSRLTPSQGFLSMALFNLILQGPTKKSCFILTIPYDL